MKFYEIFEKNREVIEFSSPNKGIVEYQLKYLKTLNLENKDYEIREVISKEKRQ